MKKTIIFDFDGTIADTFKMTVEIGRNLTGNETVLSSKDLDELRSKSMFEVVEELKVPKHMWPFLLFRGRRQMAKQLKDIKMFIGIQEVLESLHNDGYRLLIISSNSSSNISKFLSMHGCRKYFRKIYGGVGLLSKASALRKVVKRNKLNTKDVIYVGDEVRDIEAARDVDIEIVAVSWGFNDKSLLKQEEPLALASTRAELLEALEIWGNP